jgi:GNAT superfamily N-acetyltransferase
MDHREGPGWGVLTTILQAKMPEHATVVHDLFAEYLRWVCQRIFDEYRAVFDPESMITRDMQQIDVFLPPRGLLLIAHEDGLPAGCACARTIEEGTSEIKRMYVRPAFRRRGIGAALLKRTIEAVRDLGHSVIRLDSARFMSEAHALYHSFGFRDIQPYRGTEIPAEYWTHWVFMECRIASAE